MRGGVRQHCVWQNAAAPRGQYSTQNTNRGIAHAQGGLHIHSPDHFSRAGVKNRLHNPEQGCGVRAPPSRRGLGGRDRGEDESWAPWSEVFQVAEKGWKAVVGQGRRGCTRRESALERQEALLTTNAVSMS